MKENGQIGRRISTNCLISVVLSLLLVLGMNTARAQTAEFSWLSTHGEIGCSDIFDLVWGGSTLYAGTRSQGVWYYNSGSGEWINAGDAVSSYEVGDMVWGGSGLYACCGPEGVWYFDPTSGKWTDIGGANNDDWFWELAWDGSYLYAGRSNYGLWRYDPSARTWANTGLLDTALINALTWNGSDLFISTDSSGVFSYNPGTAILRDLGKPPISKDTRSLTWGNAHLYAGTEGQGLWCYDSGSGTWSKVSGSEGNIINSLVWDGSSLYAGVDKGVCRYSPGGDSWSNMGGAIKGTYVYAVCCGGSGLYAGTYGWGVWYADISTYPPVGPVAPGNTFYFAEGYTGAGFDEYLCLMNPADIDATAEITYMFTDGTTQKQELPIQPTSRATVNVNSVVGPDRDVSLKVCADIPIVAERPMYFNYNGSWTGGHDVVGAPSPATSFYFAEGYTGDGFDEYLCLMNPNPSATVAHVSYMFADGTTQNQDLTIGSTTRATIKVDDVVGSGREISARVTADKPIVAERPMYFNRNLGYIEELGDILLSGGHDVVGASAPSKSYYFAEGYTGDAFEEWLCLMNPNPAATRAHITYMFADGTCQNQEVPMGPTTRATVCVNDIVGAREVSVKIVADDPIVAERPMYFFYDVYNYLMGWSGGHDVIGATSPRISYYFAEGYTGNGFDEWLCLMNPNSSYASVNIQFILADGSVLYRDIDVEPTTRATLDVNAAVGSDKEVSMRVNSNIPIVAERPMYFFYNSAWTGGHDVVGYTP